MVSLVEDGYNSPFFGLAVRVADFRQSLQSPYPELDRELSQLGAGWTVLSTTSVGVRTRGVWLMMPSRLLPAELGYVRACCKLTSNAWTAKYGFYVVESIERLSPARH